MYLTEGIHNSCKYSVMFDKGFTFKGFAGTYSTRKLQKDLIKWSVQKGTTKLLFKGKNARFWPNGLNVSCAIYRFKNEVAVDKRQKQVIWIATEEMAIPSKTTQKLGEALNEVV